MSDAAPRLEGRAAELRDAFDRAFASARPSDARADVDLLAIRVGADPFALRLADVSALFADRKILRLPGPIPELLGLAGFRGATLPVYDLRALLGYPALAAPRWLVIAAERPIAIAFDAVGRHLRVPSSAIAATDDRDRTRRHVREVVRADGIARPIVHVPSILEAVQKRAHSFVPRKER